MSSATAIPSMSLVFLSHAGEDTAAAQQLAHGLREAGLEVWLDVERLKPGDPRAWSGRQS